VQRLISQGALNSPWALVFAPDQDAASIDLAEGNFGDGHINVYGLSLRGLHIDARLEGGLGDGSGNRSSSTGSGRSRSDGAPAASPPRRSTSRPA
jgi:hypothetical protein